MCAWSEEATQLHGVLCELFGDLPATLTMKIKSRVQHKKTPCNPSLIIVKYLVIFERALVFEVISQISMPLSIPCDIRDVVIEQQTDLPRVTVSGTGKPHGLVGTPF